MVRCENCGRFFFSTKRFKVLRYGDKELLVCPYCIKEREREKELRQKELERERGIEQQRKTEEYPKENYPQLLTENKESTTKNGESEENYGRGVRTILHIIGFFSSFICIIAGLNMITIRSVAGNTIMEIYYHSVGIFVIGIGLFVGSLLWGISYLIGKPIK